MFYHRLLKYLYIMFDYSTAILRLLDFFYALELNAFLSHKIKPNTVLIADAANAHGEILPGLVDYCLKMGFNVDVLINSDKALLKPLSMFDNKKVKQYILNEYDYRNVFENDIFNKYKHIIFASGRVYCNRTTMFALDYIKNNFAQKPLCIEHHMEFLGGEEYERVLAAALPIFSEEFGVKMINTHYYGDYKLHRKNNKVKFIAVGSTNPQKKNFQVLVNAVKNLLDNGYDNFEINVVSDGNVKIEDEKVMSKFRFLGKLSYPKMYKKVSESDYILALLDPSNQEHERYVKNGTSGTMQLVYGFKKPCLIDEYFACRHGLNEKNCILYSGNKNFAKALEEAILLNQKDYDNKISNLKELSDEIYAKSLGNFKELIASN